MTMVVRNWRIDGSDTKRVSADIDGMNVWITLPPGLHPAETGDAFLAIALLPAMAAGEDLDLTAIPPVSPGVMERLEVTQDVWTCWNSFLHRVDVRTGTAAPAPASMRGTAAFFSGGVDALYTAMQRRPVLDSLVLINGFDFSVGPDVFARARARTERQADRLGLPLLTVETNWIDFTRHHLIARNTSFGCALAAIALALAPERMIIASSNSYARLVPSGSHPVLDPLWSSDATTIEHHGCHARRDEKLQAVLERPELVPDIWVCHADPVINCGRCAKCRRLRLSLWLLGQDQLVFPGLPGDPVDEWCKSARYRSERLFFQDMIAMATQRGHAAAARRLARVDRSVRLRKFLFTADQHFLGGAIARRRRGDEAVDLMPWGAGPYPE